MNLHRHWQNMIHLLNPIKHSGFAKIQDKCVTAWQDSIICNEPCSVRFQDRTELEQHNACGGRLWVTKTSTFFFSYTIFYFIFTPASSKQSFKSGQWDMIQTGEEMTPYWTALDLVMLQVNEEPSGKAASSLHVSLPSHVAVYLHL